MKKISFVILFSLACITASSQAYFYGANAMIAEYEEAPDSVITIPLYRTPTPAQNVGALSGVFSVSPTRKVRFSRGNLQYETTTGVWRFATNQYDTVGGDVTKQFVDLFGYGTSGWSGSGATAYQPTSTSTNEFDYTAQYAGVTLSSLTGYMEQRDWGIHNPILNGGNQAGLWRLLTYNEYDYIFGSRWVPYGYAIVNGVYGVVLFPDNWDDANNPNDYKIHPAFKYDRNWKQYCTLTESELKAVLEEYGNDTLRAARLSGKFYIGYDPNYGNDGTRDFIEYEYDPQTGARIYNPIESYNVTPEEWLQYENLGCVFWPFGVSRDFPENIIKVNSKQLYSLYWTSTDGNAIRIAYIWHQGDEIFKFQMQSRLVPPLNVGGCVRLVQDY